MSIVINQENNHSTNIMAKKTFTPGHKKQRGAVSVDVLIGATLVIGALMFVISKVPDIRYAMNMSTFQSDVSTISDATFRWKKRRPNYDTVSINKLCTDNYLTESICGSANDGKSTNPFGGDWTVKANTNKGLYDIGATMPNDAGRINEMGDTMAPTTRGNCIAATGCATLKVTGTTITMTY